MVENTRKLLEATRRLILFGVNAVEIRMVEAIMAIVAAVVIINFIVLYLHKTIRLL